MDQRRIEFETGYGLEGDLPDVICYRIQQRYMVPALKAGQTDAAVREGVAAIMRQLSTGNMAGVGADSVPPAYFADGSRVEVADVDVQALAAEQAAAPSVWPTILGVVGWVVVLVLYILLWYATTRERPNRLQSLPVLLIPIGLGIGLLLLDGRALAAGLLLGVGYGLPWLYALWYLRRAHARLRGDWAGLPRHEQYQNLQQAQRGLGFTAYAFPLPLLWLWCGTPWSVRWKPSTT